MSPAPARSSQPLAASPSPPARTGHSASPPWAAPKYCKTMWEGKKSMSSRYNFYLRWLIKYKKETKKSERLYFWSYFNFNSLLAVASLISLPLISPQVYLQVKYRSLCMLRTCSLNWVKLEATVMPKGFIKVLKNNQPSLPNLSPIRLHKDLADVLFKHSHHALSDAVLKINQIWETLQSTKLPGTGEWKHQ